jgi:hypothetical protein
MGQREKLRQVLVSRAHGFGKRLHISRTEVISLGVTSDEERQPYARQHRAQPGMPVRSALGPRGKISRFARARIAQARGDDGDAALVVERVAVDPQPLAQEIARRIVPGNSALVHATPRRLADEQDASRRPRAQHRPGRIGKLGLAHAAGADFGEQLRKFSSQ